MRPQLVTQNVGADVAVALFNPKYPHNVGAAVRAASCFGISQVWFSGNRVSLVGGKGDRRLPREERMKGYSDVDVCHADYFFDAFPSDVVPVAVEVRENSEMLPYFEHPEKALYVFGPEDGGLERPQLMHCQRFVTIPMNHCANLSSAVYIVLYDRMLKQTAKEMGLVLPTPGSYESRGWEEPDHMTEEVGLL